MYLYEFVNNYNFFFNFKLFLLDELIVLLLLYNFVKLIIFSSILELLWPTQFFNRRHTSSYLFIRNRSFTETIIKLRRKTHIYNILNKSLYKYIFFKKK